MKKLLFLILTILSLVFISPSYALIHSYKGLTGGANANLDGIPVAYISDGEIATGADASNIWRFYYYDASNNNTTNPENSPSVIVPDDNGTGTGAWKLIIGVVLGANGYVGIDDTTRGVANFYGAASTDGGKTVWYSAGDNDSNEEYWACEAQDDEWWCGPASDPDRFIFNNAGIINPSDSPNVTLHHDTNADDVSYIGVDDSETSDGSYAITRFGTLDADGGPSSSDYFAMDGQDEQITIYKPKIPTSGSGVGIYKNVYTSNYDIETNLPNLASGYFVMGSDSDANVEFELPATGFADADETSVKIFYFLNNETDNYDMILDPNDTDTIWEAGASASCGAGNKYYCGDDVAFITLIAFGSNGWLAIDHTGQCACSSQQ